MDDNWAIKADAHRMAVLDKVLRRVKVDENGCWVWQGPCSGNGRGGGYPRMSLRGHTVAVHRAIYTHFFGYVPRQKQIHHKCNNRLCCNPEHLEMTTHLKNQREKKNA